MRFMMMIKGNAMTESGTMPGAELMEAMGKYNEALVKAGVLLAGDGLHPSSRGARVKFSGGQHVVIDGPFSEAKELIAGYWMIQVKSLDEALEWAFRIPGARNEVDHFGGEFEVELRQVYDSEDFGSPEVVAHEQALRAEIERQQRS